MQPLDKKQPDALETRIANLEDVLINCTEKIQENNDLLEKILSYMSSIQQFNSNILE